MSIVPLSILSTSVASTGAIPAAVIGAADFAAVLNIELASVSPPVEIKVDDPAAVPASSAKTAAPEPMTLPVGPVEPGATIKVGKQLVIPLDKKVAADDVLSSGTAADPAATGTPVMVVLNQTIPVDPQTAGAGCVDLPCSAPQPVNPPQTDLQPVTQPGQTSAVLLPLVTLGKEPSPLVLAAASPQPLAVPTQLSRLPSKAVAASQKQATGDTPIDRHSDLIARVTRHGVEVVAVQPLVILAKVAELPTVIAEIQRAPSTPVTNAPTAPVEHLFAALARQDPLDRQWLDTVIRDVSTVATKTGDVRFRVEPEGYGKITIERTADRLEIGVAEARSLGVVDAARPQVLAGALALGVPVTASSVVLDQSGSKSREDARSRLQIELGQMEDDGEIIAVDAGRYA